MAYDKENRRLYVDESSDKGGIALWQIADCLRYYKRDKNGNRNLGTIIKNADINKWAKYKPVDYKKDSPLTDDDRALVDWGMRVVGKYLEYQRPTSQFRARDFDGYNHLAQCPLQSTSHFNKTLDLDTAEAYLMQEIPIYPSGIVATGDNVELPLNNLTAYPYNNYIGLVFENRNSGAKWYHSFDFTLKQCVEQSWEIDQSHYPPLANMPNTNNGDVVDVWYCLATSANVEYGAVYSGMVYFAMDEYHGHFVLNIQRFTLDAIGINTPQSAASTISYSYSGSNAVISQIKFNTQLNYQTSNEHFEVDTEYLFLVNGSEVGQKVAKTLYLTDIQSGVIQITKTQSVTVSSSTLVANDYEVEVECRANLAGNDDYKTVMHYKLNVQTGAITNL